VDRTLEKWRVWKMKEKSRIPMREQHRRLTTTIETGVSRRKERVHDPDAWTA
jgi:hypothetical protein